MGVFAGSVGRRDRMRFGLGARRSGRHRPGNHVRSARMPASSRAFLILGLLPIFLFTGCSQLPRWTSKPSKEHAFITYLPPAEGSTRLRLAVKDNIDVKGIVTTAGSRVVANVAEPAKKDAPALAIARRQNVEIVGKTNMSELAAAPSGLNEFFGTPLSPLGGYWRRIPGGSSSGSAVAVATDMADVALGTDTAGSVRVPAACCGVVGLKTTFGLVPLEGIFPVSPKHLDTVGPMGKDIEHTVKGMELLQEDFARRYAAARAANPTAAAIRVGRLRLTGTDREIDRAVDAALVKAGFEVVPLSDDFRGKWEAATREGNRIAAAGVWLNNRRWRNSLGLAVRTRAAMLVGRITYNNGYEAAVDRQGAWQKELKKVFQKVDLIALPTLQTPPPRMPIDIRIGLKEARMLSLQNTVAVNYAGNPALAMPIPLHDRSVKKASLQLIGPRGHEAELLNAGRLVEDAVKKK